MKKILTPNKYYIHALLGCAATRYYVLKGPYYFYWFAKFRAYILISNEPYGTALVNQNTNKPKTIHQFGVK